MSIISRFINILYSNNAFANILLNKLRFPTIHFGKDVVIKAHGSLQFASQIRIGKGTRIDILDNASVVLGESVNISRYAYLYSSGEQGIAIGDFSSLQDGCRIYGDVRIGQNVIFAPNVFASSGSHIFKEKPYLPIAEQDTQYKFNKPVVIEDDCWLGINCVIMPGVIVGKGCIVGSNAVVTKNVAPYTIVGGVPATQIGKRFDFVPPTKIHYWNEQHLPYFYSGFNIHNRRSDFEKLGGLKTMGGCFEIALNCNEFCKIEITCKNINDEDVILYFGNQKNDVANEFGILTFHVNDASATLKFYAERSIVVSIVELSN